MRIAENKNGGIWFGFASFFDKGNFNLRTFFFLSLFFPFICVNLGNCKQEVD